MKKLYITYVFFVTNNYEKELLSKLIATLEKKNLNIDYYIKDFKVTDDRQEVENASETLSEAQY